MVTRGESREGGINWEIGMDIYTLLYVKWITNKDLLHSTGNSTQYIYGNEAKRGWIYVYVYVYV